MTSDEVKAISGVSQQTVGSIVFLKQVFDREITHDNVKDDRDKLRDAALAIFRHISNRAGVPQSGILTYDESRAYAVEACKWFVHNVEML